MNATCFLVEPTQRGRRYLRRYAMTPCTGEMSYHNATSFVGEFDIPEGEYAGGDSKYHPHSDPLWPVFCGCGYQFAAEDEWQVSWDRLWVRRDTGAVMTLHDKVPGMMYDAVWYHDYKNWCGPDGRALHVILPNGHTWFIDGSCSNCTMPNNTPEHKCWVRHGEPPVLTVDKDAAREGILTCAAGAGSIWSMQGTPQSWHGFLTNGVLVEC